MLNGLSLLLLYTYPILYIYLAIYLAILQSSILFLEWIPDSAEWILFTRILFTQSAYTYQVPFQIELLTCLP